MITPFNIYFNAKLIWQKHEFWRLFTNFFYFGNLGGWERCVVGVGGRWGRRAVLARLAAA